LEGWSPVPVIVRNHYGSYSALRLAWQRLTRSAWTLTTVSSSSDGCPRYYASFAYTPRLTNTPTPYILYTIRGTVPTGGWGGKAYFVGLYKIFVYFEAVVHKAAISFPPPRLPALPTLVQYYCTIIGQYTIPLPTSCLFAIHHTILAITISCKGQSVLCKGMGGHHRRSEPYR